MDHTAAMAILKDSALGDAAVGFGSLLEPCLAIAAQRMAIGDLPLGVSRFGGVPDIPDGFVWPSWKKKPVEHKVTIPFNPKITTMTSGFQGARSLQFIALIDLSQLPSLPVTQTLPRQGTLYFFADPDHAYDFDDVGGCRVIYQTPEAGPLRRLEGGSADAAGHPYHSCSITFQPAISGWIDFPEGSKHDYTYMQAYVKALNQIERGDAVTPLHRLGGGARTIQDGGLREWCVTWCQSPGTSRRGRGRVHKKPWRELNTDYRDWKLLLQVDSDHAPGWQWGDGGMLYYMIHKDDLAVARFDRVLFKWECY